MEQHHCFLLTASPGTGVNQAAQSVLGLPVSLCLQLVGQLRSGTAVSGRRSSCERSYFVVQVKETPIFSAVGDLLALNRC